MSFGIVKDIIISNQDIIFLLKINTTNQDHKNFIEEEIIAKY